MENATEKHGSCWFVVLHCASAEDAAIAAARVKIDVTFRTGPPRILRAGEKLGKRGECY
jgi:hypothetical protein